MIFNGKILACLLMLLVMTGQADGQQLANTRMADMLTYSSQNSYDERIELHTDREVYLSGTSLRFSIYLLDARTLTLTGQSEVISLELLNQNGQPVVREKFKISGSTGASALHIPKGLPTGNYLLRAYTNWMRNAPPSRYFHKQVVIINARAQTENRTNPEPDILQVRYAAEGNHCVQGIENRMAMRVTDRFHKGFGTIWSIVSSTGDTVSKVHIDSEGYGSFVFTPESGMRYGILYRDSLYAIPVAEKGVVCRADVNPGEVNVTFRTRGPLTGSLALIVHQRGELEFYRELEGLSDSLSTSISTRNFPPGIHELVLLEDNRQVCSRLFVIPENAKNGLNVRPERSLVSVRDSLSVEISGAAGTIFTVACYLSVETTPGVSDKGLPDKAMGFLRSSARHIPDHLLILSGADYPGYDAIIGRRSYTHPPELKGQLISGNFLKTGATDGSKEEIYIGRLGRECDLQRLEPNPEGAFYFSPRDQDEEAQYVFLSRSGEKLSILIHPEFSDEFADLWMPDFNPDNLDRDALNRYFLATQLQQLYQDVPFEDSVPPAYKFYGKPDQSIRLKDYIELPIMEEFFRELLNLTIFIRENGTLQLRVLSKYTNRIIGQNPLYLVDGLPVFDTQQILDLDPRQIAAIHVKAARYVYGNIIADGIIDIESLQDDAAVLGQDEQMLGYLYQPARETVSPPVEQGENLPDQRTELAWMPAQKIGDSGSERIMLHASDVPGTYLLVVEGLSPAGRSFRAVQKFEVK